MPAISIPQLSDLFPIYERVAGVGSLLELRERLFAENVEELKSFAHAQRLEDVEGAIIRVFEKDLTLEKTALLKRCRVLRNKILHCDFRAARDNVAAMGANLNPGRVWKRDLLKPEAPLLKISDSSSSDGGIYGWLLECEGSGFFREAERVFREAIDVVNELRDLLQAREAAESGA